jgi:hypothetical protein
MSEPRYERRERGERVVNMHGRPTAGELVDAVRVLLRDLPAGAGGSGAGSGPAPAPDAASGVADAPARHQIRIAIHALEIVTRELALGPAQEEAHRARLSELGFDNDASLADAIRSGRVDDGPALRRVLREDTRDRLLVANPGWLPAEAE